jgi:phosphoglycerate kinase
MDKFPMVDVGRQTVAMYQKLIDQAETIFVNGPLGIFEQSETEYGTQQIWEAFAKAKAFTVVGGGDSINALNKYNLGPEISYVSTAGGGLVRFLSGEELPVIKALRQAASRTSH